MCHEEAPSEAPYRSLHMFGSRFVAEEKIYSGMDAGIWRGYERDTFRKVIIKQAAGLDRQVGKEIGFLSRLSHQNIIEIIEYDHSRSQFLVVPFAAGGDLISVVEQGRICEAFAKKTVFCILRALSYIHGLGIVHNDIKPDNIFITDNCYRGDNVVLGDFGMACDVNRGGYCQSPFGTQVYMPPERLCGAPYNSKADIWSLGVTLFICLFQMMPFEGDDVAEEICGGLPIIRSGILDEVSEEASDLLVRMLNVDPEERISAEEAMLHPWFSE